ncbi:MAG: SAM-dependent methyltransferase [Rhodobacteraceae bacterium]|nr:SAM-dependent methyltransferase [Paracoccaceae bacterium]
MTRTTPPELTDRAALLRNRARASATRQVPFLHQLAQEELQFRLDMVNRPFNAPAIITGLPQVWADFVPDARVVADDPVLDLQEGAHDLVLHVMALHWASDPVGQMVQARRALRPDGLFLGVMFGGQTLAELRSALAQAEADLTGGLSPRVVPMAEIRDLGALLQRAGLALPVADSLTQTVAYSRLQRLFDDLREMGERNALAARRRSLSPPALFRRTEQNYAAHYADDSGRLQATYELIFLTGWAPDDSQPRPLRPGSAKMSLADALGSVETPLPDQVKIPGND